MEKTKHSVVKHLIAVAVALLLFGSSGGVAWGQVSGNLAPNDQRCSGSYQAYSYKWTAVDNNYGPGEGNVQNNAPVLISSGMSIASGTHGKITVGGTSNLVGYESADPIIKAPAIPNLNCPFPHSDRPGYP